MSRLPRVGAATTLALGIAFGGGGLLPPSTLAATTSVVLVTDTTYVVLPDEHRVAVTVDITATSRLRDTVTRRYYVDRAYLSVLPEAAGFQLATEGGTPSVSVSSRTEAGTTLLLRFGSRLGAGKSMPMTLTFDIVDPGGAPDRPLRISPSLVSFQAWAFGSEGVAGSSVRVRLPGDYAVLVGRGPLSGPSIAADGWNEYSSEPLDSPATFVADVVADRPGALLAGRRSTQVGDRTILLLIRSWPDDPEWRARVSALLDAGLPALAAATGIGWRLGSPLEVRETLVRPTGGSAAGGSAGEGAPEGAAFDPAVPSLDVPFTANPSAVLHGAAHAWFNGTLVADRWIAEGFAGLYAERAGRAIGVKVVSPSLTEAGTAQPIPLNAWAGGSANDVYGHAASLVLARAIEARAGEAALRDIWAAAADGIGAYQPGGWPAPDPGVVASPIGTPPEAAPGPPDWRTLLDLLEARTGRSFDGLWRTWVVRVDDVALLDARAAARALYDKTVAAAGDWQLPRSVRDEMRAWAFEPATEDLLVATEALRRRDEVAVAAAAAGLTPPESQRTAFEGTGGLASAVAEGVTELAVIAVLADVAATRPPAADLVTDIGLLGAHPDADLAAAGAAFAAGDLDAALRLADAARSAWAAAGDLGQTRMRSGVGLALAVVLLAWLIRRALRPTRRAARRIGPRPRPR